MLLTAHPPRPTQQNMAHLVAWVDHSLHGSEQSGGRTGKNTCVFGLHAECVLLVHEIGQRFLRARRDIGTCKGFKYSQQPPSGSLASVQLPNRSSSHRHTRILVHTVQYIHRSLRARTHSQAWETSRIRVLIQGIICQRLPQPFLGSARRSRSSTGCQQLSMGPSSRRRWCTVHLHRIQQSTRANLHPIDSESAHAHRITARPPCYSSPTCSSASTGGGTKSQKPWPRLTARAILLRVAKVFQSELLPTISRSTRCDAYGLTTRIGGALPTSFLALVADKLRFDAATRFTASTQRVLTQAMCLRIPHAGEVATQTEVTGRRKPIVAD
jgi:hypothetical protein